MSNTNNQQRQRPQDYIINVITGVLITIIAAEVHEMRQDVKSLLMDRSAQTVQVEEQAKQLNALLMWRLDVDKQLAKHEEEFELEKKISY